MKNIKVTPLPLYRNIAGKSLFENPDPVFKEYRRRWHEQPLNFQPGNFPLFIDIEVTNACNLRCTFCATTYFDEKIKRQFIDPALVYKILDEGKINGLYGVKFNDRGEPLMHPDLVDFVKCAKGCGLVDVYFNTNAMLLTEKRSREMIDAELDRISISVEGANAEFYERYRINGNFEVVTGNIRRFWKMREERKSKRPLVRIQSVLLPEISDKIDEYLDEYKQFWGPYADEISVIEYKEEASVSARDKGVAYPWACHQLWQRMVVRCDGQILPCNEDNYGNMALGNISFMTIKEAWNSKALMTLRDTHKEGKAHLVKSCDTCYLRAAQIDKLNKTD